MLELRKELDSKLLQLQALLDEHFEDCESVQDAFNALACALDEELVKE
jgi:hypothetical protein